MFSIVGTKSNHRAFRFVLFFFLISSISFWTHVSTAQTPEKPEIVYNFDIPPSTLIDAIQAFTVTTGVQVLLPQTDVSEYPIAGLSGKFNARDGLEKMLADTGLAIEQAGAQTLQLTIPGPLFLSRGRGRHQDIEEIIVIGTKQGLALQQVTDSVELISELRAEREVVFNVAEAISRAANASVVRNDLNSINIRGINRFGTDGTGAGQAINIYFDGAPASNVALEGGGQSLWDVGQVEVLRGSQSTVQGRNAIAGAVVVQSNPPTYHWEGAARVLAAEYDTQQYAATLSGPIVNEQLAFRLSTDYQDTDGFTEYGVDGEPAADRDSITTRGSILIEPDALDALSALITAEYSERNVGSAIGQISSPTGANEPEYADFDPTDFETFSNLRRSVEYETTRVSADIAYELTTAITLQLLGTFEDASYDGKNGTNTTSSFGDTSSFFFGKTDTYTAEARLDFAFENWTGLLGAYYFKSDVDQNIDSVFLVGDVVSESILLAVDPTDSLVSLLAVTDTQTENYAVFTQWRWEPNPSWAFDVGLRYDNESYDSQRVESVETPVPASCSATVAGFLLGQADPVTAPCALLAPFLLRPPEPLQSDDFDAVLPRGAITYNINQDVSLFVSARRGYRSGGTFLTVNDFGQFIVGDYDPEFLLSYEAGWRSVWLGGRLVVNGTAFYSDYEDQQVSVVDDTGFDLVLNAGASTLYGLELYGDFRATEHWSVYGNIGLLETNIDEFIYDEFADPPVDLAGNELNRSPAVSMTLGVDYDGDSGLFGSASLNYRSSYWSDIFNFGSSELGEGLTERVDSAYVLNARLGYRFEHVSIIGFVTNLLDEDEPEEIDIANLRAFSGNAGFRSQVRLSMRQPRTFGMMVEAGF
ncbi:MAG: TonB-dependent receptor [Pseudomonadota bacterium]